MERKCITFKTETGFKGVLQHSKAYENSEYLKVLDELNIEVL